MGMGTGQAMNATGITITRMEGGEDQEGREEGSGSRVRTRTRRCRGINLKRTRPAVAMLATGTVGQHRRHEAGMTGGGWVKHGEAFTRRGSWVLHLEAQGPGLFGYPEGDGGAPPRNTAKVSQL
jgi:hypothetical protein